MAEVGRAYSLMITGHQVARMTKRYAMTSVTDNQMIELRKLLDERGIEYAESQDRFRTRFRFNYCETCDDYLNEIEVMGACITASKSYLTPEQAIAVTLENNPYDAVSCEHVISSDTLHLILDEWDIHPGWTATNENMAQLFGHTAATLGAPMLTTEQVRAAIKKYAEDTSCYIYEVYGEMCGAITDELNATLRRGERELVMGGKET